MALAERLDSLAEGLLGADREKDHHAMSPCGVGEQPSRDGERVTTPLPLSLAPGTTPRNRCRSSPRPCRARTGREPGEQPLPSSAPSAAMTGPARTGAISGGLVSMRSISPSRSASRGRPGGRRARVGGVVVGDDHHRALGVGRADLADDVIGGAPWQQPAQRARLPAGSRRPSRRRRARRARRRGGAGRAGPRCRRARQGRRRSRAATSRCRGRARPRSALGAELGELRDQPLGGAPFALGGRGPSIRSSSSQPRAASPVPGP